MRQKLIHRKVDKQGVRPHLASHLAFPGTPGPAAEPVLDLQRRIGNFATGQWIQRCQDGHT